eukprot:COSAG03_NODE_510_length_7290_cov_66.012229_1_plen_79_part_10
MSGGLAISGDAADAPAVSLYDPSARDATYTGNWAKYLVDLHDARATFDFCGGMMFQVLPPPPPPPAPPPPPPPPLLPVL